MSGETEINYKLHDQAVHEDHTVILKTQSCGLQFQAVSKWQIDLFKNWTDKTLAFNSNSIKRCPTKNQTEFCVSHV